MKLLAPLVLLVLLVGAGILATAFWLGDRLPGPAAIRPPATISSPAAPAAAASPTPRAATNPPAAPAPGATQAPGPTPAPGEVVVQLDEATLTQQVNASLSGQPVDVAPLGTATLRNLSVQLRNGQIAATGTAQVGPTNLPISIAGTPDVQAGRLRVALTDARVSGLPLPSSTRQYVEQSLQAQVDQVMAAQRVRARTVTVADGRLTVVGARA